MSTSVAPEQVKLKEEQDFVNKLAGELEAGTKGVERGRVKSDREASAAPKGEPKPKDESTTSGKPSKAKADQGDEESATPKAPGDKASGDDEGEGAAADQGKEKTPGDKKEKGADDKADDDEKPKAGKKKGGDDLEDDDEEDEDELASEARSLLKDFGVDTKIEDLPKELRGIVQRRLDEMTAGFTRAMQEGRAYRKDERKFREQVQFIKDNPALFIAEMLEADEELEAKINEQLKANHAEGGKEKFKSTLKESRQRISTAFDEHEKNVARIDARSDEIEAYVRTACRNLKLEFGVVVDSVLNALRDKSGPTPDLTQKELDSIIGRHAKARAKMVGERKAEEKKEEIRGRAEDRKSVSPAAKANASSTAAQPGGRKAPANDQEFIDLMERKRTGG